MTSILRAVGLGGEDNDDNNHSFGANRLSEKEIEMEEAKNTEISVDRAKEAAKEASKAVAVEAKQMLLKLKDRITPDFVVRLKNKKIYTKNIEDTEGYDIYLCSFSLFVKFLCRIIYLLSAYTSFVGDVKDTIVSENKIFQRDKARYMKMKERLSKEKIHKEETKKALEAAKEVQKGESIEDYNRRRALMLAEIQVAQ